MMHASPLHTIEDLLPRYDRALRALGRRKRGRECYCGQMDDFDGWLDGISVQSVSTLQLTLSAMRSFFDWCVVEKLRPDNPALRLPWPMRALAPHIRAVMLMWLVVEQPIECYPLISHTGRGVA